MNIVEFGKFAGDAITRGSAAALELPASHGTGAVGAHLPQTPLEINEWVFFARFV